MLWLEASSALSPISPLLSSYGGQLSQAFPACLSLRALLVHLSVLPSQHLIPIGEFTGSSSFRFFFFLSLHNYKLHQGRYQTSLSLTTFLVSREMINTSHVFCKYFFGSLDDRGNNSSIEHKDYKSWEELLIPSS